MDTLALKDVFRIINLSGSTEIADEPKYSKPDRWSSYGGNHRVHLASYPFEVLYFNHQATRGDVDEAAHYAVGRPVRYVVYPQTARVKSADLKERFPRADFVGTIHQYLESLIGNYIEAYKERLVQLKPKYFVNPPVKVPFGTTHKTPNPILSFFTDQLHSLDSNGGLAIVLAEPGQGKTYLCRHLVAELVGRKDSQQVIPLSVESIQWSAMALDEQKSLGKTILHSFRHFDVPIPWIQNCEDEFLNVTLKAGLFRIIFDGFDEYILRNRDTVSPIGTLKSLAELASSTGARIVITSRTSFWNTNLDPEETKKFVKDSGAFVYYLEPFTKDYAKTYFSKRLPKAESRSIAGRSFEVLLSKAKDAEILGRGFVLDLIADLAEEGVVISDSEGGDELLVLVKALCQREKLRQELPFSGEEQVGFLTNLAAEGAQGEPFSDSLLELAIQEVCPSLDTPSRLLALEKLKSHPLLKRENNEKLWYFAQEQVEVLLLAEAFLKFDQRRRQNFLSRMKIRSGRLHDFVAMILDLISSRGEETMIHKLKALLTELGTAETKMRGDSGFAHPSVFRTTAAMMAVEKIHPRGAVREDRTRLLADLIGRDMVSEVFTGVFTSFNLENTKFRDCEFRQVTWANCRFSKKTRFENCRFVGAGSIIRCDDFGSAEFLSPSGDPEALAIINNERVKSGARAYSVEDLRNDFEAVLRRFVGRSGVGVCTIETRNLIKGAIGHSRHKDEIIAELTHTVIEHHSISGAADGGYNVRESAIEAMNFFATNNTYIGPIRQAFDALRVRLKI